MNPTLGSGGLGCKNALFCHPLALAIAIDAGGGTVNQGSWRITPAQGLDSLQDTRVRPALRGRGRQVEHTISQARQTVQRHGPVKVAQYGPHTRLPERRDAIRTGCERHPLNARARDAYDPHPHITTPDDQNTRTAEARGERAKWGLV